MFDSVASFADSSAIPVANREWQWWKRL